MSSNDSKLEKQFGEFINSPYIYRELKTPSVMTLNQAIEKLTNKRELNVEQQKLRVSLVELKVQWGGDMMIHNIQEVENIIEFGSKEGK